MIFFCYFKFLLLHNKIWNFINENIIFIFICYTIANILLIINFYFIPFYFFWISYTFDNLLDLLPKDPSDLFDAIMELNPDSTDSLIEVMD